MKKRLSFAIELALVLSIGTTALASNIDTDGGRQDIDVNAKYVDGVDTPTVYDVNITWGAMEFTYSVSGEKTWNTNTHSFDISASGSWSASGNEIYVTNHSNTGIKADFTYANIADYDSITGTFSDTSITLPSAVGKAVDATELTGNTALTLSGSLPNSETSFTKVGSVTVVISKS